MVNILPRGWQAAFEAAVVARRAIVIGASDMGKSYFVRRVLAGGGGTALIDLDPGQKMIGAPGTLGLGRQRRSGGLALERFTFTGSTSPVHLGEFLAATRSLLRGRRRRMVVNTSGLVQGIGVRLQQMTIEAVRPDLIVAIADGDELDPILAGLSGAAVERIRRPPGARRKGPGERERARQQAFLAGLDGAVRQTLPADILFQPALPLPFLGPARPICAISNVDGRQICIGVVEEVDIGGVTVFAPRHGPGVAKILIGRMWAEPVGPAWRLLERLQPSWE